jgi:hypothetical protein
MNLSASTAGRNKKIETIKIPAKDGNKSPRPKLILFYCTNDLLTPSGAFSGAGSFEQAQNDVLLLLKHLRHSLAAAFLRWAVCIQLWQPSGKLLFHHLRTQPA